MGRDDFILHSSTKPTLLDNLGSVQVLYQHALYNVGPSPHPVSGLRPPMGGDWHVIQDKTKGTKENECKPIIMSYIFVYQHNNVINWPLNQLDMFLIIKIKG